jgi:hypothetical protein
MLSVCDEVACYNGMMFILYQLWLRDSMIYDSLDTDSGEHTHV